MLAREFQLRGIPFEREVSLPITYKGALVGAPYKADFLCFGDLVVELKSKRDLGEADRNQVVHYLRASTLEVGLLLNFGEAQLDFQRFACTQPASVTSAPSATT